MTRPVPVVREWRWVLVIPQFLAMAVLVAAGVALWGHPIGTAIGLLIYLTYSIGSRALCARHQKEGMRHIMKREWTEALPCFERSQGFFERYPWVDRYRAFLLMSPSGGSYHEMALVNQAVCLLYLDRGAEARAAYEKALELYPDSPTALAGLKAMDAGRS